MNRRTLFATIAGLLCTKAKVEPKAEKIGRAWTLHIDGSVIEHSIIIDDGRGGVFRIDNSWSEKWGEQ